MHVHLSLSIGFFVAIGLLGASRLLILNLLASVPVSHFTRLIRPSILCLLHQNELDYLQSVFASYNGFPSVRDLWQLMDEQWIFHKCDPRVMDDRVTAFYRHPVWLLNGLFIEQDPESLAYRKAFAA